MIREIITRVMMFILGSRLRKRGRIALEEERWEDALINTEKALTYLPFDTECLNNKGVSLSKLRKYKEALKCFDMVIARYKCFEDDSLYFEGDDGDCLKEHFICALNNKGSLLNQMGKKKEAKMLHKQVLQLDPGRESAIHNLRLDFTNAPEKSVINEDIFESVKQNLGSEIAKKVIKKEIKAYDSTLKKNPKDVTTLINKGTALAEINEFDEAMSCYDLALKIDSDNITALCNKGGTLGRMGKYKEAIQSCDKVLKIEPNNKVALEHKELLLQLLKKNGA